MQLHANKLPLFEARKFCASLLPSTHPLLFVQLQWLFFALPTGLGDRWRSNDPTKNKGFIINISMHGSWKLSNVQNLYQTSRKTSLQFLAGHWLFLQPKKKNSTALSSASRISFCALFCSSCAMRAASESCISLRAYQRIADQWSVGLDIPQNCHIMP